MLSCLQLITNYVRFIFYLISNNTEHRQFMNMLLTTLCFVIFNYIYIWKSLATVFELFVIKILKFLIIKSCLKVLLLAFIWNLLKVLLKKILITKVEINIQFQYIFLIN